MNNLNIILSEDKVEIWFSSQEERFKTLELEFILDFNEYGSVLGIEIINLKLEAGKDCLSLLEKTIMNEKFRYSYDIDCDAFYLQLSTELSVKQEAIAGEVILDKDGAIIGFCASVNAQ